MKKSRSIFQYITNVSEKSLDQDYCNMGSSLHMKSLFTALNNLNHKTVAPNFLLDLTEDILPEFYLNLNFFIQEAFNIFRTRKITPEKS